jgi:hypothetical protein
VNGGKCLDLVGGFARELSSSASSSTAARRRRRPRATVDNFDDLLALETTRDIEALSADFTMIAEGEVPSPPPKVGSECLGWIWLGIVAEDIFLIVWKRTSFLKISRKPSPVHKMALA